MVYVRVYKRVWVKGRNIKFAIMLFTFYMFSMIMEINLIFDFYISLKEWLDECLSYF